MQHSALKYIFSAAIVIACIIPIRAYAEIQCERHDWYDTPKTNVVQSCSEIGGVVHVKKFVGVSVQKFPMWKYISDIYRPGTIRDDYTFQVTIESRCVNSTTVEFIRHEYEETCFDNGW